MPSGVQIQTSKLLRTLQQHTWHFFSTHTHTHFKLYVTPKIMLNFNTFASQKKLGCCPQFTVIIASSNDFTQHRCLSHINIAVIAASHKST